MTTTEKFRKTAKGVLTNSYSHQKNRHKVSYSLCELHEMFLKNKRFLRLFKEWEDSNYERKRRPVIDRIDCMKGYDLSNIQILTAHENRYKQNMELRRIRARKIGMYFESRLVKTFKSVSAAVKETGLNQANISSCLTGRRKTAGGHTWKYELNIHQHPELLEATK